MDRKLITLCLVIAHVFSTAPLEGQVYFKVDSLTQMELTVYPVQFNEFLDRFNDCSTTEDSKTRKASVLKLFYNEDPRLLESDTQFSQIYIDRVLNFVEATAQSKFTINRFSDQVKAVVEAQVLYRDSLKTLTFILHREVDEPALVRWVISGIECDFLEISERDSSQLRFLSPVSHELGFMDLKNAMKEPGKIIDYTRRDFEYDLLSVFLYQLATGSIEFVQVIDVEWELSVGDRYLLKVGERRINDSMYGMAIYDLLVKGDGSYVDE